MPYLETTKILLNGLMTTWVWGAPEGPSIPTGKGLALGHLLVEIFHRLFSASQAKVRSLCLQVIDLPSAEAHPGWKLELHIVGLFGARSKEMKAIDRVKKEGIGIGLIVCQNCLESIQLRGEKEKEILIKQTNKKTMQAKHHQVQRVPPSLGFFQNFFVRTILLNFLFK